MVNIQISVRFAFAEHSLLTPTPPPIFKPSSLL